MKKLQIITPCSRPENLTKINDNIKSIITIDYDWYIIFDKKTEPVFITDDNIISIKNNSDSKFGNVERNMGLKFKDQYEFVYFLDDDNIIHENFMKIFDQIDSSDIYVFNQKDRAAPAKVKQCKVYKIDTACFLIRSKIIDIEWNANLYEADGVFIENLAIRNAVKYIDEDLCLYNALRQE